MVWENLNEAAMPLIEGVVLMNDFSLLVSRSEQLTAAREHLNELLERNTPRTSARNILTITKISLRNWL